MMDWPSFVLSLLLGFLFLLLSFYFVLHSRPSLSSQGTARKSISDLKFAPSAPSLASMPAPTPQLSSTTGPSPRVSLQKRSFAAVSTTSQQIGLGLWWEKVLGLYSQMANGGPA